MNGFYYHVSEAISINKERSKHYNLISKGKTKKLSRLLIASEYLTLPIALYYDYKAKIFNKNGIPIVKNDFVSMDINPWDKEVLRRGKLKKNHLDVLKKITVQYLNEISNSENSFSTIYNKNVTLLEKIKKFETDNNIHLAMTKHIAESMALIMKNGIQYSVQSDGRSNKLTKSLFNIHKIALRRALNIDKRANKFHIQGFGIILNDLPDILYK